MSAEHKISQYPDVYEKISDSLPGQSTAWLNTLREQAVQQFSTQGFPSLREEEWRYTNVSAIEKKLFSPVLSSELGALDIDGLNQYLLADA